MKHFIILIFVCMSMASCIKDVEAQKKEKLFLFFNDMKVALEKEDLNWIGKNYKKGIEAPSVTLPLNTLKNYFDYNKGEYSATINYIIGASEIRTGSYIIRNLGVSTTYYYIGLEYDSKKNKWLINMVSELSIGMDN